MKIKNFFCKFQLVASGLGKHLERTHLFPSSFFIKTGREWLKREENNESPCLYCLKKGKVFYKKENDD